jgi:hypothetical protein
VYDGRQYPTTPPAEDYRHPFGYNQAYSIWNQNNRPFRIIDFAAKRLNTMPDIIHKYGVNQATQHTEHKTFMLLHFEQDEKSCRWRGVLAEVWDDTKPKDYTSTHEFKYISER